MVSFETDCMMADAKGTFRLSAGFSPFLNFTRGVLRETLSGTQSSPVYPGIRRYSLKVLEGSLK